MERWGDRKRIHTLRVTVSQSSRVTVSLPFHKRLRKISEAQSSFIFNFPLSSERLLPLSLERKGGPVVRRSPALIPPHRYLGGFERRRRTQSLSQHAVVEPLHKIRRSPVVYQPQTRHHSRRPGVHKTARQSDQPLAFDLLTERRLAGRERHTVRPQPQVVDVIKPQKTVLRAALLIYQRKHQR